MTGGAPLPADNDRRLAVRTRLRRQFLGGNGTELRLVGGDGIGHGRYPPLLGGAFRQRKIHPGADRFGTSCGNRILPGANERRINGDGKAFPASHTGIGPW